MRNSCKHPVVVLTEIKFEHLKSLIDFIYNGKVNIFESHLPELLRIANILKIKGLVSEESIIENSSENDDSSETEPNNSTETFLPNVIKTVKIEPTENDAIEKTTTLSNAGMKSIKKRKSVSFSEIPEIVYGELSSEYFGTGNEQNDKKKRKLRSSTEMCTITKIDPLAISDKPDYQQSGGTSQFIGTCSTSNQTPEPMRSEHESVENRTVKARNPNSRKMIRKNENFLRALEAVRTQGIGFCKAAKIHGVNNRTLWLEYQKLGYPMKNARKKSN